jgi:hypothetical protein
MRRVSIGLLVGLVLVGTSLLPADAATKPRLAKPCKQALTAADGLASTARSATDAAGPVVTAGAPFLPGGTADAALARGDVAQYSSFVRALVGSLVAALPTVQNAGAQVDEYEAHAKKCRRATR